MKIFYARVSTDDQNLDVQLKEAERIGADRIYQEKRSGKNVQDRPEFLRMLDTVRSGDTVIVYSIDRFGRDMVDIVTNVKSLHKQGIKFQSIMEPMIDTTTEFGELVLGILASIADYIRKYNRRKSLEGIAEAKRQGKHCGRMSKLDKDQQELVRVLYKGGKSMLEISRMYKVSKMTIFRIVKGEK